MLGARNDRSVCTVRKNARLMGARRVASPRSQIWTNIQSVRTFTSCELASKEYVYTLQIRNLSECLARKSEIKSEEIRKVQSKEPSCDWLEFESMLVGLYYSNPVILTDPPNKPCDGTRNKLVEWNIMFQNIVPLGLLKWTDTRS